MEQFKKIFWEECPNCGAELIVTTECDPKGDTGTAIWFCDGDEVVCGDNCGYVSAISADDGGVWLQDGNIDELEIEN